MTPTAPQSPTVPQNYKSGSRYAPGLLTPACLRAADVAARSSLPAGPGQLALMPQAPVHLAFRLCQSLRQPVRHLFSAQPRGTGFVEEAAATGPGGLGKLLGGVGGPQNVLAI